MNSTTTNFRVSRIFTSNTWAKLWLGRRAASGPPTGAAFCTRSSTAGEAWSRGRLNSLVYSHSGVFVLRRLDTRLLRRFCSAAGYGWDYPDSESRDLPLCFPEFLCSRLLLMVLTDGQFGLSPAGESIMQSLLSLRTFLKNKNHLRTRLQVSIDCGRLWKPLSRWMSWRGARSHCRREFWLTDKRRHVWRWTSACLLRLAPDPWSGRASWPWSPKTSSRDPADLNPAQKWVGFPPKNIGV